MFNISFEEILVSLIYVVPAIIIALTFHEYAHARVAYAYGDPTAKDAGRLTLNPLKHLDPIGTLVLIIANIGWAKPVPVNAYYFEGNRKRKLLFVSLAGPMANLAQAILGAIILSLLINFASYNSVSNYFTAFLSFYVWINIILAVLNLLPIPPLDGSKILAGILPDKILSIYHEARIIRFYYCYFAGSYRGCSVGSSSPYQNLSLIFYIRLRKYISHNQIKGEGTKMEQKQRLLSGMRPTGKLHLGHQRVIEYWKELSETYESFHFTADWHAITTQFDDTGELRDNKREIVIDWLSAGLDPQQMSYLSSIGYQRTCGAASAFFHDHSPALVRKSPDL